MPKNTGPVTNARQVQEEAMEKAKNPPHPSHMDSVPLKKLIMVKTELSIPKKPAPSCHDEIVSDSVLRAAMPATGPMPQHYDDVLDISMYSDMEIDNEQDHQACFYGLQNYEFPNFKMTSP